MRIDITDFEDSREKRGFIRILSRERLIAGFVALAFLALFSFLSLRWFEHAVSFHPNPYDARLGWRHPNGADDVWVTTTDGVRLHGWFFQTTKPAAIATIIYFHGNGGNISNVGWVGETLAGRGFNVLLLDYRGYGRSEGDVDDEMGLYADADAGYQYVTSSRDIRPESVVLYGQSLGTALAADLASRRKCAAVILESGFSSASDLASTVLPLLPRRLHFLAKNRFESSRKLSRVNCPVLIVHGEPDETIPTENGHRLFAAANQPKALLIFPGAGHNVFGSQGNKYLELIAHFVSNAVKGSD